MSTQLTFTSGEKLVVEATAGEVGEALTRTNPNQLFVRFSPQGGEGNDLWVRKDAVESFYEREKRRG